MAENLFGQEEWQRRGEAVPLPLGTSYLPVGVPVPWPGATAPAGWLICDGSAIPTGCPTLTALYGANLPNLKGRVIVGLDAAQAEFDTMGETGGAKTVTLSSAEMPSHTHVQDAHDHIETGHTHATTSDGQHSHGILACHNASGSDIQGWPAFDNHVSWRSSDHGDTVQGRDTLGVSTLHGHTATSTSVDILNATPTNQNTGGGGAHSNLQPYKVFNYIVAAA